MSEKSPSVEDRIKTCVDCPLHPNKMCDYHYGRFLERNQTLAQVEKILDECIEEDCNCDTDYTLRIIRKEIKKIHSQGERNLKVGDVLERRQGAIVTSSSNGIPKLPDTNTQNLKGCGEAYNGFAVGVCGTIRLCEKCHWKEQSK